MQVESQLAPVGITRPLGSLREQGNAGHRNPLGVGVKAPAVFDADSDPAGEAGHSLKSKPRFNIRSLSACQENKRLTAAAKNGKNR